MTPEPSLIDEQRARIQLRQRWELAYVLSFFRVFRPVIPKNLKIPAEDIETALIAANENLRRIHIAILMGIPPITKSMTDPDAWITSVCKKIAKWWLWVAEGEIPLRADHGREILSYKQLDPTKRLLILKALCDVRAEQDDILQFIEDELKKRNTVGSFRKERMEVGDSGVSYWYEGDPVIGHRLYREIGKTYSKQKAKGKGCVEPTFESQWETVATNLEEFPGIMDSLSSSNIPGEAFVGETIKTLPVFKNIEKQERLTRRLEGYLNCRVVPTRSCRDRRPARYTFEEYDRSIDEAIKIATDPNYVEKRKAKGEQYRNSLGMEHPSSNGRNMDTLDEISGSDEGPESSEVSTDAKSCNNLSDHDDATVDYGYKDGAGIDEEDDDDIVVSDSEKDNIKAYSKPACENKNLSVKLVAGLRRSIRNSDAYRAVTKKRLRQRPTKNADYNEVIVLSDSEDENPAKSIKQTATDLSSTDGSPTAIASSDEITGGLGRIFPSFTMLQM